MLCPNCHLEFNSSSNIPRILIFCGHTYCHPCIEQLLQQNKESQDDEDQQQQTQAQSNQLNCPECDTLNIAADGVNSFPKNLVLLQVNSQQAQQYQLSKQNSNKEAKKQEIPQKFSNDHTKALCSQHSKKLEAFCEKDLQVLCIECILSEQHKSHEIISVQKAVEKQKQNFFDEVTNASKTEEKLKFIQSDVKRHISEMHSQADKNRKELSQIYSYIRDLILEREQALKRQISENLVREEQESDSRLQEISDFMNQINNLKQELLSQSSESEIEILQKAKQRSQISQEINGIKARELISFNINNVIQVSQSLQEIKRESELMQISKIINPTYKGPTTTPAPALAQQSSSLYQHTMSTASKLKKTGTQVQSQISGNPNGLNQVNQQNQNMNNLEKTGKEEIVRKSTKLSSQIKSKISPHRMLKKHNEPTISNKKQGVMVLDQNKQKLTQASNQKPNKCQGSFNNIIQNQINLYNYNNQNLQASQNNINIAQSDEPSEDQIGTMGGEDMSSIYPLENNDCYFQYQDNGATFKNGIKRDESVGALDQLLDSLNKSTNQIDTLHHEVDIKGLSTTGDTGNGSQSDVKTPPPQQEIKLRNAKSTLETPKSKKQNPWRQQTTLVSQSTSQNQHQSLSNKKRSLKKENSTNDLDNNRFNAFQKDQNNNYQGLEEKKEELSQRCGSLSRYNSNNALLILEQVNKNYENSDLKLKETLNTNQQLSSLSLERNRRKQLKLNTYGAQTDNQSPFRQDNFNEKQNIMEMLQECTKNIEKLDLKPINKKQLRNEKIQQDSPSKLQTVSSNKSATVCIVDLSRRDDQEQEQPLRLPLEEKEIIHENEEEESVNMKHLPNFTNQKDLSPFKNKNETSQILPQFDIKQLESSPPKTSIQISESLDRILNQTGKQSENLFETTQKNLITSNSDHLLQSSISIDNSVSDPFRALCRVKEEFIFVFSGFNDNKLLTCEALDVQRGTWKEICQIGKARTKFSAVPISKSRILIFGGKQADGQRTGEIEEYNLKTNKFKTLPFKLPKPRSGFAACVKREEGKIFFCGGNSGSVLRKFDCLDLKKGKWSRWPEMIQKRDELAVALGPDGKIYAIGGYGGGSSSNHQQQQDSLDQQQQNKNQGSTSNCLRTAERFDFNTGQWEMLPEMNEARRALAAVALPDGIYAIGGYDGKQYLSTVEKFDLQKQQWIPVKSMNTSRCTLSAVVSNDCQYIYALGGFNGSSLDLVERYNTMTDEWEFITPMISKRFMHESVCLITH